MPALLPGIELEQLTSEPATRSLRLKGPQKKITLKNI